MDEPEFNDTPESWRRQLLKRRLGLMQRQLRRLRDQSPLQSAILDGGCSTGKNYTALYSIVADTEFFEAPTADEKLTDAAGSYTCSYLKIKQA
ncbi:hypothetical protein LTR24_006695 [Lithohypha guttulata]|uniref:Uncharacterized protein n=1 Tax=Lithohypha guttulata TaxID=1690604 RepID=A0ABR0K539_9EURO|nr:hypothetical protein LTR24_006695 [Lithohypha guttulata]